MAVPRRKSPKPYVAATDPKLTAAEALAIASTMVGTDRSIRRRPVVQLDQSFSSMRSDGLVSPRKTITVNIFRHSMSCAIRSRRS